MGPFIAARTISQGQFVAAGSHRPMKLRELIGSASGRGLWARQRSPSAGVRKKTRRTPRREIELALRRAEEVSK